MYHFFFADVALANNSILYHKAISHCLLSKLRFLQTVRELKGNIFNKVLDLTYLIFLYKKKEADLKEKVYSFLSFFGSFSWSSTFIKLYLMSFFWEFVSIVNPSHCWKERLGGNFLLRLYVELKKRCICRAFKLSNGLFGWPSMGWFGK